MNKYTATGGGSRPIRKQRNQVNRFAALDLGTNNCRLLIAAPRGDDLRIVDAFSRIVRLGEGLSRNGALSKAAMARTIDALSICAEKMDRRRANFRRCIATQACRGARNGAEFLDTIHRKTGLEFEIITPEEEARLSVEGCGELIDAPIGLIFDIGGGSTEISWVERTQSRVPRVLAWTSIPIGVVSLAEHWGGREISIDKYEKMIAWVREKIAAEGDPANVRGRFHNGEAHLLGTSGTVTSLAGVYLKLPRYRRDRVDGLWLKTDDARLVSENLRAMSFDKRAAEPCIGVERADLVVCGCAILEALLREWPANRIRVADRGLREGILAELANRARKQSAQQK